LRHRLLNASLETEVLAKLYRKHAFEMGFEEFHMYLRYVQFDFAKFKENAGNPPPLFVSELNPEESQIDRYIPNNLYLAIHEIEEGQIGRLSFKGKENVQNLLRPGGVENLQIIVKLQLSHNNALISAITQAHSCFLSSNLAPRKSNDLLAGMIPGTGSKLDDDTKSERKSAVDDPSKIFNLRSIGHASVSSSSKIMSNNNASSSRLKSYSDAFVSIQLEKVYFLNKLFKKSEPQGRKIFEVL
jgi:hypothetical protein